jgi:hypothetical protein
MTRMFYFNFLAALSQDGTPLIVQKVEDQSLSSEGVQYATLSGAAASSLIELSKGDQTTTSEIVVGEDGEVGTTILIQQHDTVDTVVEIPGTSQGEGDEDDDEEPTRYILVTTDDNEQKLVPLSQYSQMVEEQAASEEDFVHHEQA